MDNYDDIFYTQPAEPSKSAKPDDSKKDWAARKQEQRKEIYNLIDSTTEQMVTDGELFQTYLDVQSRFDRYSVKNAILVTAQRPDAEKLASFDDWSADGVSINKGEKSISILIPDKEYHRSDGSKGTNFLVGKVFDISQTSARSTQKTVSHDHRRLLEALVQASPCPIQIRNDMPADTAARFSPDDWMIGVRQGLDAHTIFRSVAQEISVAYYAKNKIPRSNCEFDAYCISYILCKRNGIPTTNYRFDRLPENLSEMKPKDIQNQLKRIRDTSGRVSDSIRNILEPRQKESKARNNGAR